MEYPFKLNFRPRTKRVRGIFRRANRILKEAHQFDRILDSQYWFNHSHWHRDWAGIGNHSRKIRLITLKAHLQVFRVLASTVTNLEKPFQLFIFLNIDDAGHDAVFLHTPNPHSLFPADFHEYSWGVPEFELLLHSLLPEFRFKAGRCASVLVAYPVGFGVPLDPSSHDA